MLDIQSVRKQFPAFSNASSTGRTPVYLDGPGGTQVCRSA